MIIQCPQCGAKFNLPDAAIPPAGRVVKCGKCKHNWHVSPASAQAAPPPPPPTLAPIEAPTPTEADVPQVPVIEKTETNDGIPEHIEKALQNLNVYEKHAGDSFFTKFNLHPWQILVGILLIFISIIMGTLTFAPQVVGFVSSSSFALSDVSIRKMPRPVGERFKSDKQRYAIEGNLINQGEAPLSAPSVRITLLDENGQPINRWYYPPQGETVAPGGGLHFAADNLDTIEGHGTHFRVEAGNRLELFTRTLPNATPVALPTEEPVAEPAAEETKPVELTAPEAAPAAPAAEQAPAAAPAPSPAPEPAPAAPAPAATPAAAPTAEAPKPAAPAADAPAATH